jgi:hypothetical protein
MCIARPASLTGTPTPTFVLLHALSQLPFPSINKRLTSLSSSKLAVDHAPLSVKIILLSVDSSMKLEPAAPPMPNKKRLIKNLLLLA